MHVEKQALVINTEFSLSPYLNKCVQEVSNGLEVYFEDQGK